MQKWFEWPFDQANRVGPLEAGREVEHYEGLSAWLHRQRPSRRRIAYL
jgi:hypothetical protein